MAATKPTVVVVTGNSNTGNACNVIQACLVRSVAMDGGLLWLICMSVFPLVTGSAVIAKLKELHADKVGLAFILVEGSCK